MKTGKTLQELSAEIARQQKAKKDYVLDTQSLEMSLNDNNTAVLTVEHGPAWGITDVAHSQIGEWAGIPAKYYGRMRTDAPALLADNVNHWFAKKHAPRMVRTLDNDVRAFLSNRFLRLDHVHMMNHVLPVLAESKAEVRSSEITPTRLYIKSTIPGMEGEVKKGDAVRFGIVFSNSEIGLGKVRAEPFVERLICLNGMVMPASDFGHFERSHLGGEQDLTVDGNTIYASDTMEADSQATWLKVRDIMKAFLCKDTTEKLLGMLRQSTEQKISGDIPGAVTTVAKMMELNQDEESAVLRYLVEGGDITQWGIANAVTRMAADVASYDRATELEVAGGRIIDLKPGEWQTIATAKPSKN